MTAQIVKPDVAALRATSSTERQWPLVRPLPGAAPTTRAAAIAVVDAEADAILNRINERENANRRDSIALALMASRRREWREEMKKGAP